MKLNLPNVSETLPRTSEMTVTLSAESLDLLGEALRVITQDAYDAGVSPERVFHLARDFHRVSQALRPEQYGPTRMVGA